MLFEYHFRKPVLNSGIGVTSDLAHLLIVDDDANTLASLSRAFRLAGHEATVCDNASRAVELLRTEKFDLIFSDVVMPGKSGLEFLEEIKIAGVKAPVILISGQANIEMAVRATKLGALDFLEKPLSTDKLLVTVENAHSPEPPAATLASSNKPKAARSFWTKLETCPSLCRPSCFACWKKAKSSGLAAKDR